MNMSISKIRAGVMTEHAYLAYVLTQEEDIQSARWFYRGGRLWGRNQLDKI